MALTRVYGIYDPEFPYSVRYVGKTVNKVSRRIKWHIAMAKKGQRMIQLYPWLLKWISSGVTPPWNELRRIEGSVEDGLRAEQEVVEELVKAGHILLNKTGGGWGLHGFRHSEETKKKMALAGTRRTYNTEVRQNMSIAAKERERRKQERVA